MTRKHRHNHASRGANQNITKIAEVKTILPSDGTAVEFPLPEGIQAFFSEDGKLMLQKKSNDPANAPQNFGITYEEIAEKLFLGKKTYYGSSFNIPASFRCKRPNVYDENNCKTEAQVRKMFAYNKLLTIANYLNDGWKPTFGDCTKEAFVIGYGKDGKVIPIACYSYNIGLPLFPSKYICQQAIRIMGKKSLHYLLSYEY